VLVGQITAHRYAAAGGIGLDDALRCGKPHELRRRLLAHRIDGTYLLHVEGVVELLGGMHLAIVDMDGREEYPVRMAGRKLERHGVGRGIRSYGGFKLEDRKAVVLVDRDLVPEVARQSEARVQTAEIIQRRNEARHEIADGFDVKNARGR